MARTVAIERRQGSGTETVVLPPVQFEIKMDGDLYSPAITTEIEIERSEDTPTIKDQCGNVERRKQGTSGWQATVSGYIVQEGGPFSLTLPMLRDEVAKKEAIDIRSDILPDAKIVLSNIVITQSAEVVSLDAPWLDEESTVFEFQLQLGETEADA